MNLKTILTILLSVIICNLFSQEINPYKDEDGKYGFKNEEGQILITAKYKVAYNFSHGYALVSEDGLKWKYINDEGLSCLHFEYDPIQTHIETCFDKGFSGWFFIIVKNSLISLVDKTGKVLNANLYSYFDHCESINSQYGFDNKTYEVFEKLSKLNMYFVGRDQSVTIINKYGQEIGSADKYEHINYFEDSIIAFKHNSIYRFYDYFGNPVIPKNINYKENYEFSEGLAAVPNADKYGFIDTEGNTVIPFQYDKAYCFNKDRARIVIDRKIGLIDKTGKYILDPIYEYISPPNEECYQIIKEGLYGLADSEGKIIFKPEYDYISPFKNGIAKIVKGELSEFIDKNGRFYSSKAKPQLYVPSFGDILIADPKLSQTGKYLAHGCHDYPNKLFIWNVLQKKEFDIIGIEKTSKYSKIISYFFTSKDKYIVFLCSDYDGALGVIVYNIINGLIINEFDFKKFNSGYLESYQEPINRISVNSTGDKIAFSTNSSIIIIDFWSGEILQEFNGFNNRLNFSPDDKYIASIQNELGVNSIVRISDVSNGNLVDLFNISHKGLKFFDAFFSSDNKNLNIGRYEDSRLIYYQYNYQGKKLSKKYFDPLLVEPQYFNNEIKISSTKKKIKINNNYRKYSYKVKLNNLPNFDPWVDNCVPISPNGQFLIYHNNDNLNISFYDIAKSKISFELKATERNVVENILFAKNGFLLKKEDFSLLFKVGSKNSFFLFRFKKITEPIKRFS
ncbi:MAG: WG repeat-containing protein [Saprospiraceae bacterium]|nr:WG repeat-containing protein [Saprospiraceae bacterium]